MPVIEISSLSHPGVEIFCTLTEAQLLHLQFPTAADGSARGRF